MSTKNLLLLFTRNPELGKVKSRLAKDIGQEKALRIYKELLKHTHAISKDLDLSKWVFYSEEIQKNDIWNQGSFEKKLQKGTDLGERMYNAFQEGFQKGYEKIIIIGSDIYDLEQIHIEHAFESLQTHQAVIGPSEDGGYYLLGLTKMLDELFQNKDWGTKTVLASTLRNLEGLSNYKKLEILNDIDVISDIRPDSYLTKYL